MTVRVATTWPWVVLGVVMSLAVPERAEAASEAGPAAEPPDIEIEGDKDVDWRPYANRLRPLVRAKWEVPTAAKQGTSGIATVHFFITPEGRLEELTVVARRGPESFALAAVLALERAAPFPAVPGHAKERVGVRWTFLYNVNSRARRRWVEKLNAARAGEGAKEERDSAPAGLERK